VWVVVVVVVSFIAFTGKILVIQSPLISSDVNKTAALMLRLAEILFLKGFRKGHTVWMDSFWNLLDLTKFIKAYKINCARF
jgi:hypothetical protein